MFQRTIHIDRADDKGEQFCVGSLIAVVGVRNQDSNKSVLLSNDGWKKEYGWRKPNA